VFGSNTTHDLATTAAGKNVGHSRSF
jgi:hypothetical protein